MHIGINYTPALRQGAGIGRYTRGLVTALTRLDTENEYTLVVTNDSPLEKAGNLPPHCKLHVLPLSERLLTILWHRFNLPLFIDKWAGPFDLFHATDFVLPPLYQTPGLLTVHDLTFMRHPHGALPQLRRWLNKVVPKSVERARHILADSYSTKTDLQALLGVDAANITVVGAGVDARFNPIGNELALNQVRERYNLPHTFILGLGTLEPRKNFEGLIAAFNQIQADFPDLHLVIAGGKGWLYESIFSTAVQSPASERIHLIGFVADEDLPTLYSLAHIFAYPSFYEGFGIPVLEAMACGTPVVTANNSCLPEISGGAALLVSAKDTSALATALRQLLTDRDLQARCIQLGYAQPPRYTWRAAAETLLTVYQAIGNT